MLYCRTFSQKIKHFKKTVETYSFAHLGVVLAASIIALAFWDTILLWCAVFYYSIGALLRPYNLEMPTLIIPWFQGCAQISLTASVTLCFFNQFNMAFLSSQKKEKCLWEMRIQISGLVRGCNNCAALVGKQGSV